MKRTVWIDWLRVTAIFLVVIVHSTEPFYLGGEGSLILTHSDLLWVTFFDTFARACVPLFIVASSFLQFPLEKPIGSFLRRRAIRVLVPFIIWTIIYATVWGEPVENFKSLLLNFNYAAGHLWFVYMLVGIYLLIPMLSPWAMKVSRRQLLFYLGICFLTTVIPFIREIYSGEVPVIYGPTGIPNIAKYPLWGECSWNAYGTFYYFSGFIGYLLLGLYVRRFMPQWSWGKTALAGIIPWLTGFAICFFGFYLRVQASSAGIYPFEGPVGIAALWETPWFNDTTGVALMAFGWIVLYRRIGASGSIYQRLTLPVANASYGVYLCHMLILVWVSGFMRQWLGSGNAGYLGCWTTGIEIIATAIITFALSTIACMIVERIPKIGKYIVG